MKYGTAAGWNLQNRLCVAAQVTAAAFERRESRGVHYRSDHPAAAPARIFRRESGYVRTTSDPRA